MSVAGNGSKYVICEWEGWLTYAQCKFPLIYLAVKTTFICKNFVVYMKKKNPKYSRKMIFPLLVIKPEVIERRVSETDLVHDSFLAYFILLTLNKQRATCLILIDSDGVDCHRKQLNQLSPRPIHLFLLLLWPHAGSSETGNLDNFWV